MFPHQRSSLPAILSEQRLCDLLVSVGINVGRERIIAVTQVHRGVDESDFFHNGDKIGIF